MPDNAYGTVVEAAFQQAVARRGGRIVALERYPLDRAADAGRGASAWRRRRARSTRSSSRTAPMPCRRRAGADGERREPAARSSSSAPACGTIRAIAAESGAARRLVRGAGSRPASAASSDRYRSALTARTRCAPRRSPMTRWRWWPRWSRRRAPQRFSDEVLTNPSGFAGIDGVFRFRPDGTNQRGLAVHAGRPPSGGAGDQPGAEGVRAASGT